MSVSNTFFPGSSSYSGPSTSTLNLEQKLKKKGSGRMRPFKLWVVVGDKIFTSIPKSTLRKALNKSGRVKKVEFRRSMCGLQVQNRIVQSFPDLKLDNPTFMKCIDLKMVTVEVEGGGYPNGSVLQSIASKESLYLVDSSRTPKVQIPACWPVISEVHVTFLLL